MKLVGQPTTLSSKSSKTLSTILNFVLEQKAHHIQLSQRKSTSVTYLLIPCSRRFARHIVIVRHFSTHTDDRLLRTSSKSHTIYEKLKKERRDSKSELPISKSNLHERSKQHLYTTIEWIEWMIEWVGRRRGKHSGLKGVRSKKAATWQLSNVDARGGCVCVAILGGRPTTARSTRLLGNSHWPPSVPPVGARSELGNDLASKLWTA